MAQGIGRIGGPVLQENLQRKDLVQDSIANLSFKNQNGDTPLLYINVIDNKIGVNRSSNDPDAAINVTGTLSATTHLADTALLGNVSINGNKIINLGSSPLTFTANNVDINSLTTPQININNNTVSTYNTNTDLEFSANGAGEVRILSDAEAYAGIQLDAISATSLNASGNVQAGRFLLNDWIIDDNFIDVNSSNADLELAASGAGKVIFDYLKTDQNFTALDPIADFANINLNTVNQTGSTTVTGDVSVNYSDFIDKETLTIPGDSVLGDHAIQGNAIKSTISDGDVNINTAGTGIIHLLDDTFIDGSLHATGDITLEGNIVFGDDSSVDTVAFNADVNDNVNPNQDLKYDLGKEGKTWGEVHTVLLNGQDIASAVVNLGGVDLGTGQGNIYYVAVNGDDANSGDHQQKPVATLKRALEQADTSSLPAQIYIFPGEYQEEFPLTVPANTTITGTDIRNTIIYPDTSSYDQDAFLLNGETTIENLSIQNFYYDIVNDTGYAFRFAPGAIITSRSPYIRNVTVITKGAQLSAADPRGFDSGDAGRGALIDGAAVDPNSEHASMLFHSVTFITPGVDCITMTNGVRVEWLNSFTYFADRALYAKNGTTGHLSVDGSTVEYGAEVRSIGSATIYGNKGVVADGNDVIIYLVGHNFSYVGSGKSVTNDPTLTIQENETEELNNGKVYFTSTDVLGNYRVGERFVVDVETGNTTFALDTISLENGNTITISDGSNATILAADKIDLTPFVFQNNTISTKTGAIDLTSLTNTVNMLSDVNVSSNTTVLQDINVTGSVISIGDTAVDQVSFNADIEQDIIPGSDSGFNLGSDTNAWGNAYIGQFVGDTISINDNYITTTETNADLELRANGTGRIYIPSNNVQIDNGLGVNGVTDLQDVVINGLVTHAGNRTQTGNLSTDNLTVTQDLNVQSNFNHEVNIAGNVITASPVPQSAIINVDITYRAQPWWRIDDPGDFQWYTTANVFLIHEDTDNISSLVTDAVSFAVYDSNDTLVVAYSNFTVATYGSQAYRLYDGDIIYPQGITEADIDGLFTVNQDYTIKYLPQGKDILNLENNNLQLQANGSGNVILDENTQVTNNITVDGDLNLVDITAENFTAERFLVDDVQVGGGLEGFVYNDTTDNRTQWVYERRGSGTNWTHYIYLYYKGDLIATYVTSSTGSSGYISSRFTQDTVTYQGQVWNRGELITTTDPDYYDGNESFQEFWRFEIEKVGATAPNANSIISNNNLELQASGTGEVVFDNLQADQDLTVANNTTLVSTNINGTLTHVGDRTQTGDLTVTNLTITGDLNIVQGAQLEEILFDDNVITSTSTNADLEFRATGTGRVIIDEPLDAFNLTTNILTLEGLNVNGVSGETFNLENIDLFDNVITTTLSNSNLELRANASGTVNLENIRIKTSMFTDVDPIIFNSGIITLNTTNSLPLPQGSTAQWSLEAGSIRYNSDDDLFEGFGANIQTFDQLYSADRLTNVIANSNNNHLEFTVNGTQVGNIDFNSVNFHGLQADSVLIDNNEITTVDSNADLEFRTEETITQYVAELTANETLVDASLTYGKQTIAVNDEYIAIGDPSSNEDTYLGGKVMIYNRQGDYQYTIYDPANESLKLFGGSVSLNENNILIAGAYNTPPSGRGAIIIYNVETQEQLLRVTGPTSSSDLGWTTAINNRYAFASMVGNAQIDSVRVYDLYQDPPQLVQTITHPTRNDPANNDSFGRTIAADENYLAVHSSKDGGQIFIFELEDFTLIDTLNSPSYNAWYMYYMQIRKGKLYYSEEIAPLGSDDIQFVIYDIASQTVLNTIQTVDSNIGLYNWHADDNYIYAADPNAGDDFVHAYNQTTGNLDYQVNVPTGENVDINLYSYNNELFVRTVTAVHRFKAPKILVNDLEIVNDFVKHYNTGAFEFTNTGVGYVKFDTTNGLVIPSGSTAGRGSNAVVGETRWNTERSLMEIYSGTEWIIVAGGGESITAETFENLLFEFTMALG